MSRFLLFWDSLTICVVKGYMEVRFLFFLDICLYFKVTHPNNTCHNTQSLWPWWIIHTVLIHLYAFITLGPRRDSLFVMFMPFHLPIFLVTPQPNLIFYDDNWVPNIYVSMSLYLYKERQIEIHTHTYVLIYHMYTYI